MSFNPLNLCKWSRPSSSLDPKQKRRGSAGSGYNRCLDCGAEDRKERGTTERSLGTRFGFSGNSAKRTERLRLMII